MNALSLKDGPGLGADRAGAVSLLRPAGREIILIAKKCEGIDADQCVRGTDT